MKTDWRVESKHFIVSGSFRRVKCIHNAFEVSNLRQAA